MYFTPFSHKISTTGIWLILFLSSVCAQTVLPSNNTGDLAPYSSSPRFLLNGTEFSNITIPLAPLGQYVQMSHQQFVHILDAGHLLNTDASNANGNGLENQFAYISCDPSAYSGNLGGGDVFRIAVTSPKANVVILYSTQSNHCIVNNLESLPTISGVLTTTDPVAAANLAKLNLNTDSAGQAVISPDFGSYTNFTGGPPDGAPGGFGGSSNTTAVAMIVLYSITGIITALFIIIIVTGAIRAHRHPERYGPRIVAGRGRQSRARGIARAMLETLPVVKFGDHDDAVKKRNESDIEMNATEHRENENTTATEGDVAANTVTTEAGEEGQTRTSGDSHTNAAGANENADGRDEEGHLGCSICTEDFTKGEEVRVLPCNHKFHPDCVDPWLLNISGTCPLCRIDLRPPQGEEQAGENGETGAAGQENNNDPASLPPPLAAQSNHGLTANLRNIASGNREERIAALRRLRQERRSAARTVEDENERRGLTRRFRERFRIRTEQRGATTETSSPAPETSDSTSR